MKFFNRHTLTASVLGLVLGTLAGPFVVSSAGTLVAALTFSRSERLLWDRLPRTAAILRTGFGNQYRELVGSIERLVTDTETPNQTATELLQLVQELDPPGEYEAASLPLRVAHRRAQLVTLRVITGTEGYPACAEYLHGRYLWVSARADFYLPLKDAEEAALLTAISDGTAHPGRAKKFVDTFDADHAVLRQWIADAGFPPSTLQTIDNYSQWGVSATYDVCLAAAAVWEGLTSITGEVGDRLNTDVANSFLYYPLPRSE